VSDRHAITNRNHHHVGTDVTDLHDDQVFK